MLVLGDPHISCWFFHLGPYSAFSPTIFLPRIQIRILPVFDEQTDTHNSVLFPIQVPVELPRSVLPTTILLMVVQINFSHDHRIFDVRPRFRIFLDILIEEF